MTWACVLLWVGLTWTGPEPLVDLHAVDPTIRLDMRYAGPDNFVKQPVYGAARCLLRRSVAERLAQVQADLRPRGLGLLVWDCYRPFSVQKRFWKLVGNPSYVARPVEMNGVPVQGSKHNRGAAVDLTLVRLDGTPVEMPTEHDDFSERAARATLGGSDAARASSRLLEDAMRARGFEPLPSEWWHFDGPGWQDYPLSDVPLE